MYSESTQPHLSVKIDVVDMSYIELNLLSFENELEREAKFSNFRMGSLS